MFVSDWKRYEDGVRVVLTVNVILNASHEKILLNVLNIVCDLLIMTNVALLLH